MTIVLTNSHGVPVFLDGDGSAIDCAAALRMLRKEKNWNIKTAAEKAGVSHRTWEGWEQGRSPSKAALLLLMHTL